MPERKMLDPRKIVVEGGVFVAIVVLFLTLSVISDVFLTSVNLWNVARQIAVNGIIATGMTFVILQRGIDLSVGSILAISACVAATVAESYPLAGMLPALSMGLVVGLLCGAVNGIIINKGRIDPFLTTLGTMSIFRGIALIYTGGHPINILSNSRFLAIGEGYVGVIPVPVMIFALVALIGHFVLSKTVYGLYVYGIGGNEMAVYVSGINTQFIKTITYLISGLLAGLGGVVLIARVHSARPIAGIGYELDAIAAVVIGGTSFAGGRGGIGGTIVGAAFIGLLSNGLNLLNVPSYYQQVGKGLIVVGAVLMDRWRRNARL